VESNSDSEDEERGQGGATGPVDEAELLAMNYKCPAKFKKEYRQFLQTGKSTADWIAHLAAKKRKEDANKVANKDKIKNYDAMVKERDQAKERAEAEAKSKKKAVQDARKQGADKLKVYSNTIQQCMALLKHLGVAAEDVEQLANSHLMADALFQKYTVTQVSDVTTDSGEASGEASGESSGAQAADASD
jgi:hypothetical protein